MEGGRWSGVTHPRTHIAHTSPPTGQNRILSIPAFAPSLATLSLRGNVPSCLPLLYKLAHKYQNIHKPRTAELIRPSRSGEKGKGAKAAGVSAT